MRETVSLSAAWTKAGEAFSYKRTFHLYQSFIGKRVRLRLPSFPVGTEVWVNDCPISLEGDGILLVGELTPYVEYSAPNRLFITFPEYCVNEALLSGVEVLIQETATIEDVFAQSSLDKDGNRILTLRIKAENESAQKRQLQVVHTLFDAYGKKIKKCNGAITLAPFCGVKQAQTMLLGQIASWELDSPTLYSLKTELTEKGQTLDETVTAVGFRDLKVDARRGFLLEGKPVKIKSMSPFTSAPSAVSSVWEYAMQTAQALGVNALWLKEGPHTEKILAKCDAVGFLCILDISASSDIKKTVARFRSHPSLIAWAYSINPIIEQDGRGVHHFQKLSVHLRRLDTSRPIMLSASLSAHTELLALADCICLQNEVGVCEAFRERMPHKALFLQTALANIESVNFAMQHHAYLCGAYMTYFSTESFAQKSLSSIDPFPPLRLYYGEREAFRRLQAAWQTNQPVLHLSVQTEANEDTYICTCRSDFNAKKAILYVDGRPMKHHTALSENAYLWENVETLGYVEAVALSDGKEVCRAIYEIPDKPYGLRLVCDRFPKPFKQGEIAYLTLSLVDSENRETNAEDFPVSISLSDSIYFDRPEKGTEATVMVKGGTLHFAVVCEREETAAIYAEADGYMPARLQLH